MHAFLAIDPCATAREQRASNSTPLRAGKIMCGDAAINYVQRPLTITIDASLDECAYTLCSRSPHHHHHHHQRRCRCCVVVTACSRACARPRLAPSPHAGDNCANITQASTAYFHCQSMCAHSAWGRRWGGGGGRIIAVAEWGPRGTKTKLVMFARHDASARRVYLSSLLHVFAELTRDFFQLAPRGPCARVYVLQW